jgi:hypothetical protein
VKDRVSTNSIGLLQGARYNNNNNNKLAELLRDKAQRPKKFPQAHGQDIL